MKYIVNPKMYNHPDPNINRLVETKDIVDYPIAEAQKDSSGQPVWDNAAGTYRITGKTLEVSILREKGAWLEPYVADVLLDRYDFLRDDTANQKPREAVSVEPVAPVEQTSVAPVEQTSVAPVEQTSVAPETKKVTGEHGCSQCGQLFKTVVNLGTHLGAKHPEFLAAK